MLIKHNWDEALKCHALEIKLDKLIEEDKLALFKHNKNSNDDLVHVENSKTEIRNNRSLLVIS